MTLSRRKTLALIGGGMVLAASVGVGGFAATRTPVKAQRPWGLAGSYDDVRLNALSYALLAPNPHNLQPWKVALQRDNALTLMHDETRRLPETDPYDRQIMIGMGCFLEQMVLAAGVAGYKVELDIDPDGIEGRVARATFVKGGQADPLAAHMLDRRSCKEPFETRAVPDDLAEMLAPHADIIRDPERVDALRALTFEAFMVETTTPHTMQESIDLMRFGKREINAAPDGIDMGGVFFESLILTGQLTPEILADPESFNFKQGIKIYQDLMEQTPAYAVLTSAGNTRVDQVETGRRWLRLNLATTGAGLALHPVSQALQEYPEMTTLYDAAHDLLAPEGHTVQMLGRLGYGPIIPRTPRWPLEAKLTGG